MKTPAHPLARACLGIALFCGCTAAAAETFIKPAGSTSSFGQDFANGSVGPDMSTDNNKLLVVDGPLEAFLFEKAGGSWGYTRYERPYERERRGGLVTGLHTNFSLANGDLFLHRNVWSESSGEYEEHYDFSVMDWGEPPGEVQLFGDPYADTRLDEPMTAESSSAKPTTAAARDIPPSLSPSEIQLAPTPSFSIWGVIPIYPVRSKSELGSEGTFWSSMIRFGSSTELRGPRFRRCPQPFDEGWSLREIVSSVLPGTVQIGLVPISVSPSGNATPHPAHGSTKPTSAWTGSSGIYRTRLRLRPTASTSTVTN